MLRPLIMTVVLFLLAGTNGRLLAGEVPVVFMKESCPSETETAEKGRESVITAELAKLAVTTIVTEGMSVIHRAAQAAVKAHNGSITASGSDHFYTITDEGALALLKACLIVIKGSLATEFPVEGKKDKRHQYFRELRLPPVVSDNNALELVANPHFYFEAKLELSADRTAFRLIPLVVYQREAIAKKRGKNRSVKMALSFFTPSAKDQPAPFAVTEIDFGDLSKGAVHRGETVHLRRSPWNPLPPIAEAQRTNAAAVITLAIAIKNLAYAAASHVASGDRLNWITDPPGIDMENSAFGKEETFKFCTSTATNHGDGIRNAARGLITSNNDLLSREIDRLKGIAVDKRTEGQKEDLRNFTRSLAFGQKCLERLGHEERVAGYRDGVTRISPYHVQVSAVESSKPGALLSWFAGNLGDEKLKTALTNQAIALLPSERAKADETSLEQDLAAQDAHDALVSTAFREIAEYLAAKEADPPKENSEVVTAYNEMAKAIRAVLSSCKRLGLEPPESWWSGIDYVYRAAQLPPTP